MATGCSESNVVIVPCDDIGIAVRVVVALSMGHQTIVVGVQAEAICQSVRINEERCQSSRTLEGADIDRRSART